MQVSERFVHIGGSWRLLLTVLAVQLATSAATVVWVVSAALVARWSDFFRVVLSDSRLYRPPLYAAVVCLGINTVLLLYLTVYLHAVVGLPRGDSSVYDVWCPRVIPTMTGLGVLSFLLLIRATFPVWGFLSPFVLGLETLGALFALHFVPWL